MTKTKNNNASAISNNSKMPIFMCFIMIFIYGTLLLMIGYTQGGLGNLLFKQFDHPPSYMVYLLISQSAGLILSTIVISKILSKVNIKYIFVIGMTIATLIMIVISLLDKFNLSFVGGIVLFAILSLILGLGIGPVSPLISTYISAVYSGQKRTTMLSISNGVYGIGAGIIPLTAAAAIFKLSGEHFDSIRYFYYIAAGLAGLAMLAGWFIDYKHTKQLTSSKITTTDKATFSLWKPLIFSIAIMSAYMIAETIANYMFVNVGKQSSGQINISDESIIRATQAFGLFVMIQGLWRALSGLYVIPYVKKRWFIVVSGVTMSVGFLWMLLGGMQTSYGIWLIAALFGFGIGNLWPVIYSYAIDSDERRASFIGMVINIVSMAWIPITQLMMAIIWSFHNDGDVSSGTFMAPIIIGLVVGVLMIILLVASIKTHATLKKDYGDVIIKKKD